MRDLTHPNIIKLEEVYETANSIYLIMELLDGGQLKSKIMQSEIISKDRKIIMKQILSGLVYLQEKQLMHRDLKPDNIMFKKKNSNDICIVDFGLATYETNVPYLFSRCGTPGFVAPEIANIKDPNAKYSCLCDIFSAGIIFHLL